MLIIKKCLLEIFLVACRNIFGTIVVTDCKTKQTSGARLGKPRAMPHCRVLPPGELSDMIPEASSIYSESFVTTALTVFPRTVIL